MNGNAKALRLPKRAVLTKDGRRCSLWALKDFSWEVRAASEKLRAFAKRPLQAWIETDDAQAPCAVSRQDGLYKGSARVYGFCFAVPFEVPLDGNTNSAEASSVEASR